MNSLEEIVDQSKIRETEELLRTLEISSSSKELCSLLPAHLAHRYQVIPLAKKENTLVLGCALSLAPSIVEELQFATDHFIYQQSLPQKKITELLSAYHLTDSSLSPAEKRVALFDNSPAAETTLSKEEEPIVHYVTMLLDEAIRTEASDLHLEFFETTCRVRYRIDGLLLERKILSLPLAKPVISRLKLLAHLDINERRLPQDGRLQHTWNNISVDFRLASLPTQFGESIVLRLLDRRKIKRPLSSLQFPLSLENSLKQLLQEPHGLFLVTGPTGAGKTTTLYACLQELQERNLKLLTVEDPVEYEIEGIMQVPIQESIGRTFQRVLRSSLRHDPDVIMIGETRDTETAERALQASLTGHLVLTTLHTNDAPGAISRLIEMGIDPLMISTTLKGILAQRLVRKICASCRTSYRVEKGSKVVEKIFKSHPLPSHLWRGLGCEACYQTGYQGRIGFFELLLPNDALRLLIHEKAPHHQLRAKAIEAGMKTLHEDALRLVMNGITTIEEVEKS